MNSSAPISNPSSRCSAVLSAVMNMIGRDELDLICRASSNPEPSGKPMSRITRSHKPSLSFFNARCFVSAQYTSYFSRCSRSHKVAPSERSSSTNKRRFITCAFRRRLCKGSDGQRKFKSRHKAAYFTATDLYATVHCFSQPLHDIQANAAAAAARVAHEEFSQFAEVALKAAAVIGEGNPRSSPTPLNAHLDFGRVTVGDCILD